MSTRLPQDDPDPSARAARLQDKRGAYAFDYSWPKGVATGAALPRSENYGLLYMAEAAKTYVQIGLNVAAMAIEGMESEDILGMIEERFADLTPAALHEHVFTTPRDLAAALPARFPKTWDEYRGFFATWEEPEVVASYYGDPQKLDDAFAWQRVAGANPMTLARCAALPANLGIGDELYRATMGADDSIEAAAKEGRLYLADYAALEGRTFGTTNGLQKSVAAPMALFAVPRGARRLRSVAIQLGQTPDAAIFSPRDGWRWRVAMLQAQIADANVHEGVHHFGRAHMVMEAVKLCMERQLDASHPLHKLLTAHTETTLAINHSAKTSLIAEGGTVDHCFALEIGSFNSVVKDAVDSYPLDGASPLDDLARRGLDDPEALEHPYRDDATLVWGAVQAFVGDYVRIAYKSDEDVRADAELAAFVRELGAEDGGRLKGVPAVQTVEQLAALISKLVWIAGPGHSAVNFPQYPFMGFVPNMPGASYAPIPDANLPDEEASFCAALPPLRTALEGVVMIYFLSHMRPSKLGHYDAFQLGAGFDVHRAVENFKSSLEDIESTIEGREPSRLMTYPFLKPSQILQSIAI